MSSKWFKENISAELGVIHDWYITKFDVSISQLGLPELEVGSDTVPGLQYTADDLEDVTLSVIPCTIRNDASYDRQYFALSMKGNFSVQWYYCARNLSKIFESIKS